MPEGKSFRARGTGETGNYMNGGHAYISHDNGDKESMIGISAVVPVFNSAQSLEELYGRLSSVLDSLQQSWEIIMVDDGSTDDSYEVMKSLRIRDKRVRIIQFGRNQGQILATLCGLKMARGAYVFTLDDDLQQPPEEIPRFFKKFEEGYEVVIGKYKRRAHGVIRHIGGFVIQQLMTLFIEKPPHVTVTSFRGYTRRAVEFIIRYRLIPSFGSIFQSIPVSLITNIEVEHIRRKYGKSTYNWNRLLNSAFVIFTSNLTVPSRFMMIWGSALSLLSLAFILFLLFTLFISDLRVQGWYYSAAIVAFLSGNILTAVGIIGEYIERLTRCMSQSEEFFIFQKETD